MKLHIYVWQTGVRQNNFKFSNIFKYLILAWHFWNASYLLIEEKDDEDSKKYLMLDTCCWIQKTRPCQDDSYLTIKWSAWLLKQLIPDTFGRATEETIQDNETHGFGRYLIPNNCGWMQKTRPYQDDNDMKHTTSENT